MHCGTFLGEANIANPDFGFSMGFTGCDERRYVEEFRPGDGVTRVRAPSADELVLWSCGNRAEIGEGRRELCTSKAEQNKNIRRSAISLARSRANALALRRASLDPRLPQKEREKLKDLAAHQDAVTSYLLAIKPAEDDTRSASP